MNEPFADKIVDGLKGGAGAVKGGVTKGFDTVKGGVSTATDFVGKIFDTILDGVKKQIDTLPKKFYEKVIKPVWNKIKWLLAWVKRLLSISCCCCIFTVLYYTGILNVLTELLRQVVQLITSAPADTTTDAINTNNNSVAQTSSSLAPATSLNIFEMPNFNGNLKNTDATSSKRA